MVSYLEITGPASRTLGDAPYVRRQIIETSINLSHMLVERKIINLRIDVYGEICTVVTQCFDATRANGLAYNPRFWAFIERHNHVAEFGVVSNPNDELPVKMLEFHVDIPERMPDIQAVLNQPAIPLHSAIHKLAGGKL